MYWCFICTCVCVPYVYSTAEARRHRGSRTGVIDHCQSLCGWWEWKPPQEQQMLLTIEPSRQNLSEDFLVELVDISVLVW